MVKFVVSCSKAKKGKADANASKAPLRHFVPPPPQRGEEFSPFGSFLPLLGVIKFLCVGISLALASGKRCPSGQLNVLLGLFSPCAPEGLEEPIYAVYHVLYYALNLLYLCTSVFN